MQKAIVISDSHKEILSNKAKSDSPSESCAILLGTEETDKVIVKELFLTENIEDSSVNFTVSNEQLLEAYQTAQKKNLEVIGIFHSHPKSEAIPSVTDKKFMKINPVVWLIFSGVTNDFKAYILNSDVIQVSIVSN